MVPMKAKIIVIMLHKFNIYNDSENLQKKKKFIYENELFNYR